MKKCCKETYKNAIQEVLFSIKYSSKPEKVDDIIKALEYAIKVLEESK